MRLGMGYSIASMRLGMMLGMMLGMRHYFYEARNEVKNCFYEARNEV